MKLTRRALLSLVICLLVISTALARKPEAQPTVTVPAFTKTSQSAKDQVTLKGCGW